MSGDVLKRGVTIGKASDRGGPARLHVRLRAKPEAGLPKKKPRRVRPGSGSQIGWR